jgi:UDPglucose 6-dehydrogenase
MNPDMLLIGESDAYSGSILVGIYAATCENTPKIACMNTVNAEITKLSINTYITAKISYANMLARICEKVPGADVDTVTQAVGMDSRIGSKYLKGSLSYGGPCFPRDNLALSHLADKVGAPADLAKTVDAFNRSQIKWLADLVGKQVGATVGILGLTYKPGTDVVEEAAGTLLAQELISRGAHVVVYDPAYKSHPHAVSFQTLMQTSDVIVVCTQWPEFNVIPDDAWSQGNPKIVIDCWRMLPHLKQNPNVTYVGLGIGK